MQRVLGRRREHRRAHGEAPAVAADQPHPGHDQHREEGAPRAKPREDAARVSEGARAWVRRATSRRRSPAARRRAHARALSLVFQDYSFYPRTWVLPLELADFRAQFDGNGQSSRFFIIKPDSGCQGRGIFLTQSFDRVSPMEPVVAQQYIKKPLLIDGFKFDLRLYVLVTSCTPLRVFLFNDGLVRLCTEEYVKPTNENLNDRCMHLTNYAINKLNDNFQANEDADAADVGSKRSLRWFMDWLANEKGEAKAETLWRRMGAMSVKVLMSVLPTLTREYEATFFKEGGLDRQPPPPPRAGAEGAPGADDADKAPSADGSRAFEILGIDVMIDSSLKPWLIEINHLPSFATDSPLDQEIKSRVISQASPCVRAARAGEAAPISERVRARRRTPFPCALRPCPSSRRSRTIGARTRAPSDRKPRTACTGALLRRARAAMRRRASRSARRTARTCAGRVSASRPSTRSTLPTSSSSWTISFANTRAKRRSSRTPSRRSTSPKTGRRARNPREAVASSGRTEVLPPRQLE